jgi:hypothetical protein
MIAGSSGKHAGAFHRRGDYALASSMNQAHNQNTINEMNSWRLHG